MKKKYELIGTVMSVVLPILMGALFALTFFEMAAEAAVCTVAWLASAATLVWSDHKVRQIERRERRRRRDAVRRYQL